MVLKACEVKEGRRGRRGRCGGNVSMQKNKKQKEGRVNHS